LVQKELNDLPTLASESVTVTSETTPDGGIIYTIKFTANRGLFMSNAQNEYN
jgi:hypothetical protein